MPVDHDDGPLLEYTSDLLPVPLASGLTDARAVMLEAARTLLGIPDRLMDEPWQWERGEVELRYAFYRCYELLEQGAAAALAAVGPAQSRTVRTVAPATAARWALHGLLLPLAEEWDADPGSDEWTIRRTMGHVITGQRAYGWGSAWWQAQRRDAAEGDELPYAPDGLQQALPEETEECVGSPAEILDRFDTVFDRTTERLAGLPEERLAYGARWSGLPVDLGFRLGRWPSHLREHTIQVEKTLSMIGREPTEAERMVRVVLAAYGRLEAVVFGRPEAEVAAAVDIIAGAVEGARATAASGRDAAEAIPSPTA